MRIESAQASGTQCARTHPNRRRPSDEYDMMYSMRA